MNEMNKNTGTSPSIKEELARVLQNIKNGKSTGIAELRSLLDKSPNNLEIMGHLTWALAQDEQHEEAIALYRRYLELQPENVEVRWRIADRLVNLGKLDEAYDAYNNVLKEHPDCQGAAMGIRYINYLRKVKRDENQTRIPRQKKLTEIQHKNLELNKKEFKEQRIKMTSLPPYLFLEGTKKCNFYCRTCIKGYTPYHAEDLHEDILEQVESDLKPVNTKVSITGFGEPILSKNFDKILKMFVENGSFVYFVTNGSLLNFKRIEQLARYPVDVHISMDGATKETFESIRSGSNFEHILDKLAMIKKLRDIYLSQVYSDFSICFVAIRQNIHELPDILRMAYHYRLTGVGILDYAFGNRDFDEQSLRFEPEKGNYYYEEARKLGAEYGLRMYVPPPYDLNIAPPPRKSSIWQKIKKSKRFFSLPKRFPQRCYSPWSETFIHYNGKVSPCCALGAIVGDLKKNTFQEIWNGWRYRLLRWRIQTSFPPIYCRICTASWGINKGNVGNVKAKEGLFTNAFYFCEYRLVKVNEVLSKIFHKIKKIVKGAKDSVPQPNYYKGKPISPSNSPQSDLKI